MNKTGKEYFQSSMSILDFAIRKWRILLGVAVISAIMAAVFSGPKFISPKFTSFAVVYPANLGNYSDETRLEQMQQYLESNVIRDSLIEKYDLYEEYEIDSTLPTSRNIMNKVFSENVSFEETAFESIKITASSTSPLKAKKMVDEVLDQLNKIIRKTEREKYKEIVVINQNLVDQKREQVDSLEDRIRVYSIKYGLLDYIEQSEEVTEGYIQFLLKGKKGEDYQEVKSLYNNLKKHGRMFHNLHAQLNVVNDEYMARLNNLEHAIKNYKKVQTYSNILVRPEVPDKKSYPIRWLIVVGATLAATLFTFTILLVLGYHNR
jgi:capsule polysaccharide export protein KpsE/RkpR